MTLWDKIGGLFRPVDRPIDLVAGVPRHPDWPKKSRAWMAAGHGVCEVCGSKATVVHHLWPFHFYPELEMEEWNWHAVCEGEGRSLNCHLTIGHSGTFRAFNPNFVVDAALMRQRIAERVTTRIQVTR